MSQPQSAIVRIGGLVLGIAVAFATSGCVAAGVATGPLMSAVQLLTDRTVERTVNADLAEAQVVTETVLARMAFHLEGREDVDGVRRLRAAADGVTVHVRLERVTAKLTRVGLRVETGKMVADRDTGTQMHERIAALLAPPPSPTPAVAGDPAAAEALQTLHAEIRRLRSDIEERRPAESPTAAASSATAVRLEPGAVVTPPMSAALPTVGGPAPTVSVAVPAGGIVSTAPSTSLPSDTKPPAIDARATGALQPAKALTPIQPAAGMGSIR